MRRGINYKRILVSIDSDTLALLKKYQSWGTSMSAHVRRAVKAYEKKQRNPVSYDGVDVIYDE